MNCEHRYLLREAREAADPQKGMLYRFTELQELLGKVAKMAQELFEENEQLAQRLRRGAPESPIAPPERPQDREPGLPN